MKPSPLATAKNQFDIKTQDDPAKARKQAKDKLVAAVKKLATNDLWVDQVNDDKGLERVSNRKLLHLQQVLTQVKEKFGSRKALIDGLVELEKRPKDATYRERLEGYSTPRLWDQYRSAEKRG